MNAAASLSYALSRHGLSLDDLQRSATGIALFGSRAAGCARSASDWDLFVIGDASIPDLRAPEIDLVQESPRAVTTAKWLGGELAGHVISYGVWIHGEPTWDREALDFEEAARRKETMLARKLRALERAFRLLAADYRAKHSLSIRRHVQRLGLLEQRVPVPPSRRLDEQWLSDPRRDEVAARLRSLGASPDLVRALLPGG